MYLYARELNAQGVGDGGVDVEEDSASSCYFVVYWTQASGVTI
jgi:hypothetical protein